MTKEIAKLNTLLKAKNVFKQLPRNRFINKVFMVLMLLLCLLAIKPFDASAAPVAIQNPSFEANIPGDGGWITNATVGDWTDGNINGWAITGTAGNWRPTTVPYPNGIPDGLNVAFVHNESTITQVLTETVKEGYTYTLRVYVGERNVDYDINEYNIQLYAGANLLAEDSNSLNPNEGSFVVSKLSYTPYSGDTAIGEPLQIRLSHIGTGQVSFDNISLDAEPIFLNNGLVAYYPFNGNANDASGHGNNGALTGNAVFTETQFGGGIKFTSQGDSVRLSNPIIGELNEWTCSAFVNIIPFSSSDEVGHGHVIYGEFAGRWTTKNHITLAQEPVVDGGKFRQSFDNYPPLGGPADNYAQAYFANPGQWYLVTYVKKNGRVIFYVNGVEVGNESFEQYEGEIPTVTYIGFRDLSTNPEDYWFSGTLDELRFYNRALTEAEIQALYNFPDTQIDKDGDGILDDGDHSGVAGDNPCTGGDNQYCDDNCPVLYNPDQTDNDGDGIGDSCSATPVLEKFQTIPTNGALDWENFEINGETYLAVANNYNDTTYNLNSKIYKWNGTQFTEIQSIATNGARVWESFKIAGETYLAVANYSNGSTRNLTSKIYKWNGTLFQEYQSIPTNGAMDWASFEINGETYLALANYYNDTTYNINSKVFKWNGSQFIEFQSIPTNGAWDWESFVINNETYLAVANGYNGTTYNLNTKIYKWNGSAFEQVQTINTNRAIDLETFNIGGSTYLALANH